VRIGNEIEHASALHEQGVGALHLVFAEAQREEGSVATKSRTPVAGASKKATSRGPREVTIHSTNGGTGLA
jgi:hypothetical protein